MSIMSRLPRPKATTTSEAIREMISFGGGSTSSGVSVNSDTAMRLVTVHNCVKVLYNCVSQMPCQLMEDVNDIKTKAKTHPLYKIIGKRPNGWMTAPEFWGMVIVHVSLRGNFIAFKTKYGPEIRELLPVAPGRVQEIKQNADYSLTYKIVGPDGSGAKEYSQDQIFHIRGLSLDGFTGMNPIQYERECLGLGLAGEKFLARYFGKGLHPGAIVTRPAGTTEKDPQKLIAALNAVYAGLDTSHDLMLLQDGMTMTFPPLKLVDAQFLELMRMTEAQICGMYGVPLILVQAGATPATYASSVQFKQSFVDFTIAPIAVNFEGAIDRDLLTEDDQETIYAKFNMGSLLRGNMAERFAAYAIGIDKEFMNPNQARNLEDWNSYGEQGDEYRTRTSTTKQPTGDQGGQNASAQ